MADGASPTVPPREAIILGMKYFNELMDDQPKTRVLLEGLSFEDASGNWVVTVGFDSERKKPSRISPLEALSGVPALLRPTEFEIVREFRSVEISASDGQFVKLEHA